MRILRMETKEKTKTCQSATLADGKFHRRRTEILEKGGESVPKGETHRESKEWPVDVDNLERTKVTVPPSSATSAFNEGTKIYVTGQKELMDEVDGV